MVCLRKMWYFSCWLKVRWKMERLFEMFCIKCGSRQEKPFPFAALWILWFHDISPLVPGAGGPLPRVAHGVEQRAAVDPPHAVLLHILRRHAVVPCHVPLLYVSFEKTSLNSLRLRKLLDQSTFAYWALLDLPDLTGLYWALLSLTGPYWALLGLNEPDWVLLVLTGSY